MEVMRPFIANKPEEPHAKGGHLREQAQPAKARLPIALGSTWIEAITKWWLPVLECVASSWAALCCVRLVMGLAGQETRTLPPDASRCLQVLAGQANNSLAMPFSS